MHPRLLISVQDSAEFLLSRNLGVPWIDLKNPSAGSLGMPSLETIEQILHLAPQPGVPAPTISLALGELVQLPCVAQHSGWERFDYFKVGLSGTADQDLTQTVRSFAATLPSIDRLILVHYADSTIAHSPSFEQVLRCSVELGSRYLLIDTFSKTSGALLDWYSLQQLAMMIAEARDAGVCLSLAGSLGFGDLVKLAPLGPDVLAVRGAASDRGKRVQQLCPKRVAALVSLAQCGFDPRSEYATISLVNLETKEI